MADGESTKPQPDTEAAPAKETKTTDVAAVASTLAPTSIYGLGRAPSRAQTFRDQALDLFPKALAGAAAIVFSLGFVAAVGALMLWARFGAVGLPADQAIVVVPREDMLAVGGILLAQYVGIGIAAVLLVRFRDRFGNASPATRRAVADLVLVELLIAGTFVVWPHFELDFKHFIPPVLLVVAWGALRASIRFAGRIGPDYRVIIVEQKAIIEAWRAEHAKRRSDEAFASLQTVRSSTVAPAQTDLDKAMSGLDTAQTRLKDALTARKDLPATNSGHGWTVIASGATGGTFTLTVNGQTTAAIAHNASAADVASAITGLSNVPSGGVRCTGGPLPDSAVNIVFDYLTGVTLTANSAALLGGTAVLSDRGVFAEYAKHASLELRRAQRRAKRLARRVRNAEGHLDDTRELEETAADRLSDALDAERLRRDRAARAEIKLQKAQDRAGWDRAQADPRWWARGRHWVLRFALRLSALVLAITAAVIAGDNTGETWLFWLVLGAVPLALFVLGVAQATSDTRFFWTGVALFVSGLLFASLFTYLRTTESPKIQPVVALLKPSQGECAPFVTGAFVATTGTAKDDRLYIGNVRRRTDHSFARGSLESVPNDQIAFYGIGSLTKPRSRGFRNAKKAIKRNLERLFDGETCNPAAPVPRKPVARVDVRLRAGSRRVRFSSARSSADVVRREWTVEGKRRAGAKRIAPLLAPRRNVYTVGLTVTNDQGRADSEQVDVSRLTAVLFDFAADQPIEATDLVSRLRNQLRGARKLELHGHADEVGGIPYNDDLSLRRARNVGELLKAFTPRRVRITVRAFGKRCPLDRRGGRRQLNRRVDIFVLRRNTKVVASAGCRPWRVERGV